MNPKPKVLKSSKASCIPPNWENTLNKNGSFIISFLDESLFRTEIEQVKLLKENEAIKKEKEDLENEVKQLRKTVHRIFSETK